MTKVLFTIDFDGVVSPYDTNRNFKDDPDFVTLKIGSFQCPIAKRTLTLLQNLKTLEEIYPENIVVVWASSWADLTEYFHEDSDGLIPSFPWLNTLRLSTLLQLPKSESIAEAAKLHKVNKVVTLEDSNEVHRSLRKIWEKDESLSEVELVLFKTKLKEGLTESDIVGIQSIWQNELKDRGATC